MNLRAFEQLQQLLSSLEDKKTDLSGYLCEDNSSFSIDELFSTIKTFRGLFLRAIKVSSQSESSVSSKFYDSLLEYLFMLLQLYIKLLYVYMSKVMTLSLMLIGPSGEREHSAAGAEEEEAGGGQETQRRHHHQDR